MKERVHIHTLEISGQGQVINFQVRIPRDAKRIVGILITENAIASGAPVPFDSIMPPARTGIELSPPEDVVTPPTGSIVFRGAAFFIARPRILFPEKIGSLILQTKDKVNFFYAEDVLHSDNSFSAGDFTLSSPAPSLALIPDAPSAFVRRDFKGGAKWQELCIEIDVQNTKLFGIYTDTFNESRSTDSTYQVKLYFYYEQKRIITNEN